MPESSYDEREGHQRLQRNAWNAYQGTSASRADQRERALITRVLRGEVDLSQMTARRRRGRA